MDTVIEKKKPKEKRVNIENIVISCWEATDHRMYGTSGVLWPVSVYLSLFFLLVPASLL